MKTIDELMDYMGSQMHNKPFEFAQYIMLYFKAEIGKHRHPEDATNDLEYSLGWNSAIEEIEWLIDDYIGEDDES